ncbi:MarR family winged helix-turn-helix transcriptional regulator [Streptomyces macrosporus]|uniref:Transcriptional regulator n=1 Tax=Streptomyces macrosporus TaxID=44032 RepID=A0ABN3K5Y4_9ACTN
MEYSHDDAELVRQPIGYWSWAAHKAVVTYIRAGLAEYGISQPQWWVLSQLADAGDDGRTREQVFAVLRGYLDVGGALGPETDALVDRGLVDTGDDGRMRLTSEGRAVHRTCARRQAAMRERIHEGVTDEEYLVTLKVLQRMIHNVGGRAWHH